jgi:PIN domain nuclease of toxin-antitoxin system
VILLDTHVLVWLAEDNPALGRRTTRLTDAALRKDLVHVSAVSFWEIAMLASKGRLRLDMAPTAMRRSALEQGIHEIGLSGAICIAAAELTGLPGDPADRLIVASALSIGATLVTADDSLLRWRGPLRTHDARH